MRILVADDHRLILDGIKAALAEGEGIEVVAEATRGDQVLPLIGRTNPDMVLLDVRMPGLDGFACLDRIRAKYPELKVVVMSAYADRNLVDSALRRGAVAYIVKTVDPIDLPAALRQAVQGTVFHALGVDDDATSAKELGLTERELMILRAVARGLSNQAIGKEFWVTEQTVKFHLTNIYRKIGVANRVEAVHFVYQHGLAEAAG